MRVYIETYGCQMNVYDSELVASIMADMSYEMTEAPEDADAIFLNTLPCRVDPRFCAANCWRVAIGMHRQLCLLSCLNFTPSPEEDVPVTFSVIHPGKISIPRSAPDSRLLCAPTA